MIFRFSGKDLNFSKMQKEQKIKIYNVTGVVPEFIFHPYRCQTIL